MAQGQGASGAARRAQATQSAPPALPLPPLDGCKEQDGGGICERGGKGSGLASVPLEGPSSGQFTALSAQATNGNFCQGREMCLSWPRPGNLGVVVRW